MSPEDEALIAKAMLLGCKFERGFHNNTRVYAYTDGPNSQLQKYLRHKNGGWFGYTNPVELARNYIEYFEKVASNAVGPERRK